MINIFDCIEKLICLLKVKRKFVKNIEVNLEMNLKFFYDLN